MDDGRSEKTWSIVHGQWSLLRLFFPTRNRYFGELSLKVRKNRIRLFFGRAVAFSPIAAFVLTRLI